MKNSEARYDDIIKRIAEREPFGRERRQLQPRTPHQRALDRINAYDCLSKLARPEYARWFCHGPKALSGKAWAGALVWAHRKGYHGYQTLKLHGVWAHYADGGIMLSIGTRQLPYSAPVYDAGVYRVAIASNFRIYYADKGAPPESDTKLDYRQPYREDDRLRQRRILEEIVRRWRRELEDG